jgi:biopolymer transport protein ExbD
MPTPIPSKKGRLEIIPLIDIMFFLLASFMLVSLNMINMKGMKVNLPTAVTATQENKSDFFTVSLNSEGKIFFEKKPYERKQLVDELKLRFAQNDKIRIYIQGDKDCYFGDIVGIFDAIRAAGIQKVAIQTKKDEAIPKGGEAAAGAPAAPSAPAAPAPPTAPTP